MSLKLPLASSPLRTLFSVYDLVDWKATPLFRPALDDAKNTLSSDKAITSVNVLCTRATGEIWLITVGKHGWRRRWNFGKPY